MEMRRISVLGSTGSVGRAALRVVRHLKDELCVEALAAHSNLVLLEEQVREFRPSIVALGDATRVVEFKKQIEDLDCVVVGGDEGLCAAAAAPSVGLVLFAMSGVAGLKPAFAAIRAGKQIALANKELLVCAGALFMQEVRRYKTTVLPVDSEHSALFQCLRNGQREEVRRLILTASGGPFLHRSVEDLAVVTREDALAHPRWKMGPKITVDSSTLMNKGLEKIEAYWLFGVPASAIEVVVHPQSVVHSLVEFCDGAVFALMSQPDMVLPIQYALTYPKRMGGMLPPYDFCRYGRLDFELPDRKKFPCLGLAEDALERGKSYPCALNAANEVLVSRFLNGEIGWLDLSRKLEKLMSSHPGYDVVTLDAILAVDQEVRRKARDI